VFPQFEHLEFSGLSYVDLSIMDNDMVLHSNELCKLSPSPYISL